MRILKLLTTIIFVLSLSLPSFAQSSAGSASGSAGAAGSSAAASGAAAGAAAVSTTVAIAAAAVAAIVVALVFKLRLRKDRYYGNCERGAKVPLFLYQLATSSATNLTNPCF